MLQDDRQTIAIRSPDDMHFHFRDNYFLARTVSDAALQFSRVVAMPNLASPVTSISAALDYRNRILSQSRLAQEAAQENSDFEPLMTLYLTENTTCEDVANVANNNFIHAFKLYPAGVTTGAEHGVKDLSNLYPVFTAMQKNAVPLLIHAEIDDPNVDCFDREAVFIERYLKQWVQQFPELKIVMEHVTTKTAVDFVTAQNNNIAATITPHHLWCNRNHLLAVKLRPHYYCLPILKRAEDQQALIAAATSGNKKFFLGSDGAPHSISNKENSCGCAGIYHGRHTLALYASLFDKYNSIDKLEDFCSRFGAEFYGLSLNKNKIILEKNTDQIVESLDFGEDQVKPFFAGQELPWKIKI